MEEKIIRRLFRYLTSKNIPHTRFEKEIGLSNGYLNTQLKRNADLGESTIRKIVDNCLDLNPLWLIMGQEPMLKEDQLSNTEIPQTTSVNKCDLIHVPIVDVSVAAGSGCYNEDCLNEIECISLPSSMIRDGKEYLCVRTKGRSMEPSILDGSYLIIHKLERSEWESIRDNYVYVISDTEGRAFVKRLKNRLKQHGFVVCMSDNADKHNYSNFNLYEEELNTIWYAEWYFTAKIANIQETFYKKQAELEDKVEEISGQLQQVMKAINMNNQKSV